MRTLPPYVVGDTIYCYFDTYDSSGGSVTITGLAVTDIEVYKNGSMTQRASDNGYTLLDTDGIDLDGATGFQGFSIDSSDNSDAGFWVAGHFAILVNAITVDGQTVRFSFDLKLWSVTRGLAGTALPDAAADAAGGLPISDAGGLDVDTLLGYLTGAVALASELAKVPKSDGSASWNATALAAINAEADTALSDYDPPTKAELDTAESNIRGADSDDLKALSDAQDTLEKLLKADAKIDKTTDENQWKLKLFEAGTATLLLTKNLKDVNGAAIAASTTIVGQQVQP